MSWANHRRVCDRKLVGSRFDFRTGNASLCPWKRHFTLIFHWAKQSTRCGGPLPDERLANRNQKRILWVCVVRHAPSAKCLVRRTNHRLFKKLLQPFFDCSEFYEYFDNLDAFFEELQIVKIQKPSCRLFPRLAFLFLIFYDFLHC